MEKGIGEPIAKLASGVYFFFFKHKSSFTFDLERRVP
jgi:hypothetical protein